MCGIFGIAINGTQGIDRGEFRERIEQLFRLSERRGKESCGIAVRSSNSVGIYKQAVAATELLKSKEFPQLLENVLGLTSSDTKVTAPLGLVAHTRLVTNGVNTINENNQPVTAGPITGIHNGIICNDEELWHKHGDLTRQTDVDTEVLLSLIAKYENAGSDITQATAKAFGEIHGAASIAMIFDDRTQMVLATNTGSLYYWQGGKHGLLAYASEEYILKQWVTKFEGEESAKSVSQLRPDEGRLIDLETFQITDFTLEAATKPKEASATLSVARNASRGMPVEVTDYAGSVRESINALKRCTKCVLPESFPFIHYDDEGVCNYCKCYKKPETLGHDALVEAVKPLRRTDGRPELIVSFSGGRDSSYALHYFREVLGMNVLAYTFDWGMVTDLARRNCARMCGQMGVEHILISADINQKRRNVRKNIEAWLARPDLGMIPLFMAGDKQFFTHANKLSKQTGVNDVVFSTCPYETTHFKTAFCGLNDPKGGMYYAFPMAKIAQLTWYYAKQYLLNPRYINSSLTDTFLAYHSSFFANHNYLMFFDYIRWDENVIDQTLREVYDWEISPDTKTTWRIGDGTAAFYNYIYHTVTGFTENDTFRSNQVRDGVLTREEALAKIEVENYPRWDSMEWYSRTIGFDFNTALQTINAMPRLYDMKPLQRIREHAERAAA